MNIKASILSNTFTERINHREELTATIERIEEIGGKVIWREGQYGFSPGNGYPGDVYLDPDASIAAVRHEAGHLLEPVMHYLR